MQFRFYESEAELQAAFDKMELDTAEMGKMGLNEADLEEMVLSNEEFIERIKNQDFDTI
ncbi:MAG: hypothetical protein FWF69_03870 [Firmicutes bacterium]|nr:hypothetical protein [Bacillota bacterium]